MLIDIFQPAMLAALITEFAVDSDDNELCRDDVLLRFEAWGKEKAETDVHFNEAWYIFTSLLPAYSLLCKGIASNNVLAYRAARATLYPLFCLNNNVNYAKMSLRDQSLPHRCTSEMNDALDKLISMHGQPIDFITENLVANFKKNIGADTQTGYELAQYLTTKKESGGDLLASLQNRKLRSKDALGERKGSADQRQYTADIYKKVITEGWLRPEAGREYAYTVDRPDGSRTTPAKGGGAYYLMTVVGAERAAENASAFRRNLKLPQHAKIDLFDEN